MREKPVRILQITTKLSSGGVQTFLTQYANCMDPREIVFDFAVQTEEPQRYDREMLSRGAHIYSVTPTSQSLLRYVREIYHLCKGYQIVHVHLNYRSFLPLLAAKAAGVPVRICHSHSCYQATSFIKRISRKLFQRFLPLIATEYWGCSQQAVHWLYGRAIQAEKCKVIHNAVVIEDYTFSVERRKQKRAELILQESTCVLLHVGTFGEAKNHIFLLNIFKEFNKNHQNSRLILCGDGPLRREIEEFIWQNKLNEAVILAGMVEDVASYLMAADIFVFPSLYEGLALSVIEAQISGLPCVVSTAVPKEALFSPDAVQCVGYRIENWISMIEQAQQIHQERTGNAALAKMAGYDMAQEAQKLQQYYKESLEVLSK